MELDTGAAVSVMSEQTYKTVWNAEKAPPIEPAQVQLHVYTGDTIHVLGVAKVTVNHMNQGLYNTWTMDWTGPWTGLWTHTLFSSALIYFH